MSGWVNRKDPRIWKSCAESLKMKEKPLKCKIRFASSEDYA